jgi:hypothetical protein
VVEPQTPGVPDHAAPGGSPGLLDKPEVRTLVQGVTIDILVALCLVVMQATQGEIVDWQVLAALLGKTVVYTLASSLMKHLRPVRSEEPSSRG